MDNSLLRIGITGDKHQASTNSGNWGDTSTPPLPHNLHTFLTVPSSTTNKIRKQ